MTRIKICGLSRALDIEYANQTRPDYIGFVFAKSKRQVSDEKAYQLKQLLDPGILVAGVFVNEDMDRVIVLCKHRIIDMVQLHGEEDNSYIETLRKQISNPIIKAIRVKRMEDINMAEQTDSDYLLFDAYREGQYGGSGEVFDWNMMKRIDKPYFLAGGINCGNVRQAIMQVKPYAVDISSGVETNGIKDKDKMIDIIKIVRSVG